MSEKQRKIADWKPRVNQLNQDTEDLLTEIKVIRVNAENLYGYNHDLAKRESAPGSRLVFNAVSPHWRGAEDDKDGQKAWFAARIASLIG